MTQQRFAFDRDSTADEILVEVPPEASTLTGKRPESAVAPAPGGVPRKPSDPSQRCVTHVTTQADAAQQQFSSLIRSALFVRNPRARRYVVRVSAAGVVRVTIPVRGSKRQAIAFVEQQQDWIATQIERAERERTEPREVLPPDVLAALRLRASRELPARLLELAARFGVTVSRVTIRSQRFRWGSCSRNGRISLNWRLVTMPDWVRDYVLIHELMHRRRMDHSPTFWAHVAKACPNYEQARAWLRTFKTVPPPV